MSTAQSVGEQFRSDFAIDRDVVLFNNAGVAPMCLSAEAAVQKMSQHLRRGWFDLDGAFRQYEQARASFSRLIGARPEDVSLMQTCAAAISQVALGLHLRPGDEIVTTDQEYPSNAYPWHVAAQRASALIRVVKSEPDFSLPTESVLAAIGPQTRVVAVSWVQYQTGAVLDLAALSQACRRVGAWLVVDAIQGLGVLPFDLLAMGVDAVCGGSHKWLCGPLGQGVLALAPGRATELQPLLHGAMTYGTPEEAVDPRRSPRPDAKRFEPGSPPLLSAVAAGASIDRLLSFGIDNLHQAALSISDRLITGLATRGAQLLLPVKSALRSPIVTFVPRGDVSVVAARLAANKVAFARRAGGIRLAPHAFNQPSEVERFFAIFDAA